ncbi:MAG: HAMP domain-containing histidine kinase [Treponema sp.]|nr:HAMP domain-containing histidine kinase [Treponema sp.]
MKSKRKKLKYQIFVYMAFGLFIWFVIATALWEILYYLEEKRGIELPVKWYILLTVLQGILLVLMNIPFLRFLMKHVDKPVQKIVSALNHLAEGKYDEKISFDSKNELDDIKEAFNSMAEKLEAAEKIKENAENERILLFANMAHDLKTPITSIIGFSKALSDGIVAEEEKSKYLATINSKAVKMNDLINRLFEYVKLESSENLLHKEDCDINELLRNCIADLYTEYEEKKIKLDIQIPEKTVIKKVDKVELSRVYTNLLNNILKHNPEAINVLVKMNEDASVLIADSGKPLPPEVTENIFMPFISGDKTRSSKNGSGLGLALAYKIMKKHDGDLSLVNSSENPELKAYTKGFLVILP